MKQIVRMLAFVAIMLLLMPLRSMAAKIPVAILRTNADGKTKTLTFTYAERPKVFARRGQNGIHRIQNVYKGRDYENYELNAEPTWIGFHNTHWAEDQPYELGISAYPDKTITTVVFDKSFAQARPVSTSYWFCNLSKLKTIKGIENLNTSNVKGMTFMFKGCDNLDSIDVSGFNTANVENMSCMFQGCYKLTNIDVSGFNTANVVEMGCMFQGCDKLTNIDVSGFNTVNVITAGMYGMFGQCTSLKSIDISGFNITNVEYMSFMFSDCSSLTDIKMPNFIPSNVPKMEGIFEKCAKLAHIYIGNNDFSGVSSSSLGDIFKGIGTIDKPCELTIGPLFDKSVLGNRHTNNGQDFYRWLGGYFTLDNSTADARP